MTDVKPTSGPWFKTRDESGETRIHTGHRESGRHIATLPAVRPPANKHNPDSYVYQAYIRSSDISDANARLVAAAPDLLKALQALVDRDLGYSASFVDRGLIHIQDVEFARMVLIKATRATT